MDRVRQVFGSVAAIATLLVALAVVAGLVPVH